MIKINVKIGGAAGEGIKSVGLALSKAFVRAGYNTFDYQEYPSLIRGGHNTSQTLISAKPIYSQAKRVDILIALNKETVFRHQEELTKDSLVIYDPAQIKLDNRQDNLAGNYLKIPLIELATKNGGMPVMANNVALGAVMFLTGIPLKYLKTVIVQAFGDKPAKITQQNHQAAEAGFDFAADHFAKFTKRLDKPTEKNEKMLISGNEAIALGAISAGMKFFVAYPMTPTSNILHYLAAKERLANILVKHAEDEISVINMAIAASFAGVRAMVATSGGGFSLMTEALGMAGMMELPIVMVEGSRAGPSTGMPTWHDQGDLLFVIHASQGEFPRLVLTPADIKDCFDLSRQAFYFAEKYQIPVIVLVDKYICESSQSLPRVNQLWENKRYSFATPPFEKFKRYQPSDDGISPRTIPGQENGSYLSNSYEHDETGYASEEIAMRNAQVEKRLTKFNSLRQEIDSIPQFLAGAGEAKFGLVSWGSNKGPILDALEILKTKNLEIDFLNLNIVWPFPATKVNEFLKSKERIIAVEGNATAQLSSLIREQTGYEIKDKLLKYDGRPFYSEELVDKISKLLS